MVIVIKSSPWLRGNCLRQCLTTLFGGGDGAPDICCCCHCSSTSSDAVYCSVCGCCVSSPSLNTRPKCCSSTISVDGPGEADPKPIPSTTYCEYPKAQNLIHASCDTHGKGPSSTTCSCPPTHLQHNRTRPFNALNGRITTSATVEHIPKLCPSVRRHGLNGMSFGGAPSREATTTAAEDEERGER